jgi:hypothetical protein
LLEQSLSGEKDSDVAHNMRYLSPLPTLHCILTFSEQYRQNVLNSGKASPSTSATKCTTKTPPGTDSAPASPYA